MENDQERRTILAVGLSLLIYMVYIQWFAPPIQTVATVTDVQSIAAASDPVVGQTMDEAQQEAVIPQGSDSPSGEGQAERTKEPAITDHDLAVGTDTFEGVIHSREGALRNVTLKNYNRHPEVTAIYSWLIDSVSGESSDWVPYEGGEDPEKVLGDDSAFVAAGFGNLDVDRRYQLSKDGETWVAESRVVGGLKITKRYTPGANPNVVDVVVRFENRSDQVIRDLWMGVTSRLDGEAGRFANVIRPFALVDESLERVDDPDATEGAAYERFSGAIDWFGMGDKYFMSVLVPLDDVESEWLVDDIPDGRTMSAMRLSQPLDAGASREMRFISFIGPKDLDQLNEVGHSLDQSIEFGIFGMFSRILLGMLKFYQGLVDNWGLAIILLTLTVKAVFFPLMQKQFVSSKRMQAIQPQLKELREKYKDNQTLQGQMTMKLFQEHKVNPMSGCLPMIIQMPVWFALYNVMMFSVELYGTQFLYLKDLTEVDPTGILPLLVTVLMVVQQRLMPMGNMDPMQQKMMRIMPIGFGIFMFTFPAGLALYFSVNNTLTILQQWFIYRKKDDEIPVPAKA